MERPRGHAGSDGEEEGLSPSPEAKAARMLREMALPDRREPDLPDEQLRSNDQLQQDEMLVLEAIYGNEISILGEKAGPRSFQLQVHCEIPHGINVSVEPSQDDHDHDPDRQFLENFSVEHLAPLSLTCLMPPSYPSHHPPYFTLGVQWLDNVKASSVCHMLDLVWEQQPGQEVIYEWVQWLQSSMLSHLGFDDGIVIRQPHDSMVGPLDVRVVGEILSVEDVVPRIISYNEEQCNESFLHGLHTCMVCFSEFTGVDFVKLPCHHYFCRRCMETYSRMHVNEGTVLQLVCPGDKCGGVVPPNLLKRLLGDADFERWERFMLQKALDSMADLVYCPRCGTGCLKDEDKAQCSKCLFYFCTNCRDPSHTGGCISLTPEEKLLTLQTSDLVYCPRCATVCFSDENKAQCSRCFLNFCTYCRYPCHTGRNCTVLTPEEKLLTLKDLSMVRQLGQGNTGRRINLANEILSIREVLRSSVSCPNCGIAFIRVSGCNHMVCRNCRHEFKYDEAYESSRTDRRAVDLLKVEKVQIEQKRLCLFVSPRQHRCPICHQPHPKIGNNNHLWCPACQVNFCALCRTVVRKSSEHYGPRGCKQHTVDAEPAKARRKNNNDSGSDLS